MNQKRTFLPELALVGICAIWGVTFPMVQDAVEEIATMTFLGYRFLSASIIVALVFRRRLARLSTEGVRAGTIMGAFLMIGYVFQTLGLERTSASNAGFITGMFVVLTPVFGALFMGHRAARVVWGAAAVSLIGLLLLTGPGGTSSNPAGDAMVLLTACSFSFHILFTDRAVAHHDVGALLAVQLGVTGLVCLAIAAGSSDLEVPSSLTVWSALFVTSVLASALGFFVQTYAQTSAPPARVALILTSEPVFAGIFAYLLKGETLSPAGWSGAALIMGAIVSVELVPYIRPSIPLPEH